MEIITSLLSIIIVDLVLSGDNAVVIALASRRLPPKQQKWAIIYGTAGAVVLRVTMATVAVILLKLPFLQLAGGTLLIWIAIKLLTNEGENSNCTAANKLMGAIKTIIMADFLMSLDNILAVAGVAKGNIPLLIAGLAISIPIMIFGSRLVLLLMERFPVIVYLGAGVLGWTAGEMIMSDQKIIPLIHNSMSFLEWLVPLVLTLCVVGCGKWLSMRHGKTLANEAGK